MAAYIAALQAKWTALPATTKAAVGAAAALIVGVVLWLIF